MIKYENNCCGCDMPCIECGRKHQKIHVCDDCGCETEKLRRIDGKELCVVCLKNAVKKKINENYTAFFYYFFEDVCEYLEAYKLYDNDVEFYDIYGVELCESCLKRNFKKKINEDFTEFFYEFFDELCEFFEIEEVTEE